MTQLGLAGRCAHPRIAPFGRATRTRATAVQACKHSVARRELLQLGIALPFLALQGPAAAEVTGVAEAAAPEAAPPAVVGAAPSPSPPATVQLFLDQDFQVLPPLGFKFVDTQPPYDPTRRGPAPEPSPVRARFDSPDGSTVLSVVVRNAQILKRSLVQISDVSIFGSLEEAAQLLLPPGSTVLKARVLQVVLPPRETLAGVVELPPKNYYRYELTTTAGQRVVMTAAVQRGRVYVCGGSTAAARWDEYGSVLREATESFRLRTDNMVL